MKKLFVLILFLSIGLFSFQKIENSNIEPIHQTQTNLKNLEVKIVGMTCEMGCARTIESKISKLDGVKFSKVIFAKGIGQFTYDPKVISSKDIIEKINGIGGGNMYKVVENQEVKNFTSKS